MEKVISKLSNEELDLVVGGGPSTFGGSFKNTFTLDGEFGWKGLAGKVLGLATVILPAAIITGIVEYLAISKKKDK